MERIEFVLLVEVAQVAGCPGYHNAHAEVNANTETVKYQGKQPKFASAGFVLNSSNSTKKWKKQMKQQTYENPLEELVGELQWTQEAIVAYRAYLLKCSPRNAKQLACEDRKFRAITRAIAHIKGTKGGGANG